MAVIFNYPIEFPADHCERLVPDPATIDLSACLVAVVALALTFYWKKGMAVTLAVSAVLGAVLFAVRR